MTSLDANPGPKQQSRPRDRVSTGPHLRVRRLWEGVDSDGCRSVRDRPEVRIAFTLFVLLETWLVPIEGWFVEQWGAKVMVLAGGVLAGLGWIVNAYASRPGGLTGYYAAQIVAGVERTSTIDRWKPTTY
jgi:hypothetical protein